MESGVGVEFGGLCCVPEEGGCGRGNDADSGGVEEGVGAAIVIVDGEEEGVGTSLIGVGEKVCVVVGAGTLGVGGAVAEVPDAGGGEVGAVAEVEGVGAAAFPQGVGSGGPVETVVRNLPKGVEVWVV